MEGITRWPTPGVAAYTVAHPQVSIDPPVEGTWHATINLDCGRGYVHARDEAELLAKLAEALGG
jgi:hypothetical protein